MLLPPSFFLIFPSCLSTLLQLKSHSKFCYFCICISLSLPIILSLTFSIKNVYMCHTVGRSNCNNITFHPQFILQCLHPALPSTILLISNRKVPLWRSDIQVSILVYFYTKLLHKYHFIHLQTQPFIAVFRLCNFVGLCWIVMLLRTLELPNLFKIYSNPSI